LGVLLTLFFHNCLGTNRANPLFAVTQTCGQGIRALKIHCAFEEMIKTGRR
jgi:hypothetical protein